jgi:hypothetical protein
MKTALNAAFALTLCAFLLAGNAKAQTEAAPLPGRRRSLFRASL